MSTENSDDGKFYTKVPNEVLEKLASTKLTKREARVIFAILRLDYGWHHKRDRISYGDIENLTEIKKGHVPFVTHALIWKQIITNEKNPDGHNIFKINNKLDEWKVPKRGTGIPKAKGIGGIPKAKGIGYPQSSGGTLSQFPPVNSHLKKGLKKVSKETLKDTDYPIPLDRESNDSTRGNLTKHGPDRMDKGLGQTEKGKKKQTTISAGRSTGGRPASQGAGDDRYKQAAIGIGEKLGYGLETGERVTVTVLRNLVERYFPCLTEKEVLLDIEKWKPNPEYNQLPWWDQIKGWLDNKVSLKEKDRNKG